MNEEIKSCISSGTPEIEITTKRHEFPDGSSEEIRIEKVEGGYIKKVSKHYQKPNGEWTSDYQTSVSIENPLEEKSESLIDTLKSMFK